MDKIVFIKTEVAEKCKSWITLYNTYECFHNYNKYYMFKCDNDTYVTFPKEWFIPLEEWRNLQINKILKK